jgi:hypothetical protein
MRRKSLAQARKDVLMNIMSNSLTTLTSSWIGSFLPELREFWKSHRARTLRFLRGFSLAVYTFAGLQITADTGLAPWEGRFWLILVPLFLLGEWTLRELSSWMRP